MIPEVQYPTFINTQAAKSIVLKNGLTIYFMPSTSIEVVEIQFVFNAGSWHQNKLLQSKFTSSMMFEGIEGYTSRQLAEHFDYYGTFFGADSTKDYSSVTLYAASDMVHHVLPMFQKVVLSPSFPSTELKKLISEAKSQFLVTQSKNKTKAKNEFFRGLFGAKHPYGRIARLEDFDNIEAADLGQFYQTHYHPTNGFLFVAGNVNDQLMRQLSELFGEKVWSKRETKEQQKSYKIDSKQDKIKVESPNSLQSAIRIGKVSIMPDHPDYHYLQIVVTILGGYFGSRLMKSIREEKGYTYGISAILLAFKHASYISINTEVNIDVTQQTVDEIYYQIDLLIEKGVTQEELKLVKSYLTGDLLRGVDGAFNAMEKWKGIVLNDLDKEFINQRLKALNQITPEDVMRIAAKHLSTDSMLEVVVG